MAKKSKSKTDETEPGVSKDLVENAAQKEDEKSSMYNTKSDAVGNLLSASLFLSRLPFQRLGSLIGVEPGQLDFAKSTPFFGLAGVLIAAPVALLCWVLAALGVHSVLLAILFVAGLIAASGALHEDGFADVADGFGGGKDKAAKLEIMRDSRIGAYGTLAIVLALMLRVAAAALLLSIYDTSFVLLALVGICAVSRAAMVPLWTFMPPAREEDGLSASYGAPDKHAALWALLSAILIAALCIVPLSGFLLTLIALIAVGVALAVYRQLCLSQIGGHSGDVLGAGQQVAEIVMLIVLTISI